VVETAALAGMLRDFVARWNNERPVTTGQFAGDRRCEVSPIGAVSWLAQETDLPKRTIQRVVAGTRRTTELRVADALVQAIERPDLFHDGTLRIRPNPRAPARQRASCCGSQVG
jgi:hypothetical protein